MYETPSMYQVRCLTHFCLLSFVETQGQPAQGEQSNAHRLRNVDEQSVITDGRVLIVREVNGDISHTTRVKIDPVNQYPIQRWRRNATIRQLNENNTAGVRVSGICDPLIIIRYQASLDPTQIAGVEDLGLCSIQAARANREQ